MNLAPPQLKAKSPLLMPTGTRGSFNMTSDYSDHNYYTDLGAGAEIGMFYDKLAWDKQQAEQDAYRRNRKLSYAMNLLPDYENDSGRMNVRTPNVPMPSYVNAGPVWTQGQIDAQAGLQRGNLLTQAGNQSAQFNRDLASRGFSPLSPFGMLNQQNNIMRANAGAAANETSLNFEAAKANSDAKLKGAQINAQLYGDYARSLADSRNAEMSYLNNRQKMKNEFLMGLFGSF